MRLEIPITSRAIKYGYIVWKKDDENKIKKFFGGRNNVEVIFLKEYLGLKNIDWKYGRISVGYSRTRKIVNKKKYILNFDEKGNLNVKCQ
jgi:hypothetical protein